MKFFLFFLFLTFNLTAGSFSYTAHSAKDLYQDALSDYNKKQYTKAIDTLKLCQEFAPCSALLANMYADEKGVEKNSEKTIFFYKKAIAKGDKRSLHNLAVYYHKLGDKKNAIHYYKASANEGYRESLYNLGRLYEADNNMTGALYYYREASDYAVPQGDYELALYYYKRKEYDKTKFYFEKAAKLDFEPAIKALKKLNAYLKSKQ